MAPSQGTPILVSRHKCQMQGCHDAGNQEDILRSVALEVQRRLRSVQIRVACLGGNGVWHNGHDLGQYSVYLEGGALAREN